MMVSQASAVFLRYFVHLGEVLFAQTQKNHSIFLSSAYCCFVSQYFM